jgi:endonuclease/exonuclease/phosphatase family metal-dependent hydrolase
MKFTVMSLNIMHARRKGNTSIPLVYTKKAMARNTHQIAEKIKKISPDIVGLQEVDGPSFFNGGYDQVREIQRITGYAYAYFAPSSRFGRKKSIHIAGTAIISKHPLINPRTEFFAPTFPIPRKGYAVADVALPDGKHITFVSAHLVVLDSRTGARRLKQSRHIVESLLSTPHPIVITGDMNCTSEKEETLPSLMKGLDLHAFEPESSEHHTFPVWNPKRRIDWILPSRLLRFVDHAVHHDVATDHAGVFAHLALI